MEDELDPSVGFVLEVTHGQQVEVGQPLGQVHAAQPAGLEMGKRILGDAVRLVEAPPPLRPSLIRERVARRTP
jgi:thymidine phosphorylase